MARKKSQAVGSCQSEPTHSAGGGLIPREPPGHSAVAGGKEGGGRREGGGGGMLAIEMGKRVLDATKATIEYHLHYFP